MKAISFQCKKCGMFKYNDVDGWRYSKSGGYYKDIGKHEHIWMKI
jgi:hypothetical protein